VLELNPHLARALTYVAASNRLTLYALDGECATPLASETPHQLVLVASCGAHIACAFHEGEKDEILRPGVVELRNWQNLAVITRIALPRVWFQSMALAPDATLIAIASTAENTLLMSTRDGKLIADIPGGEYITGLGFDQTSQRLAGLSTGQGSGYIGLTCQSGSEWTPERLPTPPKGKPSWPLADTFGHTAFSPDTARLCASVYHACDPPRGWWADILCYGSEKELCWVATLDGSTVGQQRRRTDETLMPPSISFSVDGKRLFAGPIMDVVAEIDANDGRLTTLHELGFSDGIRLRLDPATARLWIERPNGVLIAKSL
jgi:hypothetical protein